jgi:hypothetical protein
MDEYFDQAIIVMINIPAHDQRTGHYRQQSTCSKLEAILRFSGRK